MISMVLSLLAGVATPPPPPLISVSSSPIIQPLAPFSSPLPPLSDSVVPEVRARANLPSYFANDYPSARCAPSNRARYDRRGGPIRPGASRLRHHQQFGVVEPRCHDLLIISDARGSRRRKMVPGGPSRTASGRFAGSCPRHGRYLLPITAWR